MRVSLLDIRLHGVQHSHHLEAAVRIAEGPCCLPFRRLAWPAGRTCGGRSSGAGTAAVVGEEGSFGPVEARLAVGEVDRIERFLGDQVVLRMEGARIAAGLDSFIRQISAGVDYTH
jgi:hypothetical protein